MALPHSMRTSRRSFRSEPQPSSSSSSSSSSSWFFIVAVFGVLKTTMTTIIHAHDTTIGLHGSGTTNPSRCFWTIMEVLQEQTTIPIHATYRGIGSTNGMMEFQHAFIGTTTTNSSSSSNGNTTTTTTTTPVTDETYPNFFGSGDIPISYDIYQTITTIGSDTATAAASMVHIPILAGTVSFFHQVPNVTSGLNLTACLLSQMYLQEIVLWNDAAILTINPELAAANSVDASTYAIPITVIRRSEGSSSTHAATNYMNSACTDSNLALPLTLTGELPDWPAPTETFVNCSGSAGVTACIVKTIGSIGYIDTGHGLDANLNEVRLQSKVDTNVFFHSQEGTPIMDAITTDLLPDNPTADFSNVTFLNAGTTTTWPLILMTYIYVRTDLSTFIVDPVEQSLVIAFLKTFFTADYINICADQYGFTVMNNSTDMKAYGERAIALIEANIDNTTTPTWIFESSTQPIVGAGPYVFSSKRKEIIDVTIKDLMTTVTKLQTEVMVLSEDSDMGLSKRVMGLEMELAQLMDEMTMLREQSGGSGDTTSVSNNAATTTDIEFTDRDNSHITAALVMSSVSFVGWCVWIGVYIVRTMNRSSSSSSSSLP